MRTGHHHLRLAAVAAFALLSGTACESPEITSAPDDPAFNVADVHSQSAKDELLKAVRHATTRYHSTAQALKDGFEPTDVCVPDMGYHWLKVGRVDPVFDPMEPEVMLYGAGPNGQRQLIGVEYIVIDVGQDRPHFGSRPFDVGGTPVPADHWSLHVWLYKDNPDGLFEAFNPDARCD